MSVSCIILNSAMNPILIRFMNELLQLKFGRRRTLGLVVSGHPLLYYRYCCLLICQGSPWTHAIVAMARYRGTNNNYNISFI